MHEMSNAVWPGVAAIVALASVAAHAGAKAVDWSPGVSLPRCGEVTAPPFADPRDAEPRSCPPRSQRTYIHRHQGIGFDILDSESEACFVPDQNYRLLDEIIDAVSKDAPYDPKSADPIKKLHQLRAISERTSKELTKRGFALHVPTATLSDAMARRNRPGEADRRIFDCDTGSFILLTVAESLGAQASLVDISLPSGDGHNYVQWKLNDAGASFNWDMNQQGMCSTPPDLPSTQGVPMSRRETKGYALALRAGLWSTAGNHDAAVKDNLASMDLYPTGAIGYNNYAWAVATKEFAGRKSQASSALRAATQAVSISRSPNYLDTLACVHAFMGNFDDAVKIEIEAVTKVGKKSFVENLARFRKRVDCTGQE
jgi:hypothetical protein